MDRTLWRCGIALVAVAAFGPAVAEAAAVAVVWPHVAAVAVASVAMVSAVVVVWRRA